MNLITDVMRVLHGARTPMHVAAIRGQLLPRTPRMGGPGMLGTAVLPLDPSFASVKCAVQTLVRQGLVSEVVVNGRRAFVVPERSETPSRLAALERRVAVLEQALRKVSARVSDQPVVVGE